MNRSLDAEPSAADRYYASRQRSLRSKFACALRGLKRGIRRESNFFVHLFVAAGVIAAAAVFEVSLVEWCLLTLCITGVLAAEMFNTAIEMFAKSVSGDYNADIEDALDTASASVLLAVLGAVVVGAAIFFRRLGTVLGWW